MFLLTVFNIKCHFMYGVLCNVQGGWKPENLGRMSEGIIELWKSQGKV